MLELLNYDWKSKIKPEMIIPIQKLLKDPAILIALRQEGKHDLEGSLE